jgi:arylsulfatase A-like enzyme
MRLSPCIALLGAALLASSAMTPMQAQTPSAAASDGNVLPPPPPAFAGQLAPTEQDSTKTFPTPIKAPEGAPNILLVMTDDVGFSAASTFGGPIPTPNLDRLAARGLKYNEFHTTAICSATRAALLTGRNHHAVGTAALADVASPYPGYTTELPKSAATIARILRDNGYNTAMFGKHHNVPTAEQTAAGPFDRWPAGLGFEYFYGFVGGDTDQFNPALYQGNYRVDGSHRSPDYFLERDLTDHAIEWLHNQKAAAPDKPFFMYYAAGSTHAPQQAPADWIAKFRGRFDQGWDKLRDQTLAHQKALGIVPQNTDLPPRPKEVPAWDSLSPDEKRVDARYMEVYAGMLAYQDAQFGRLLDEVDRMGLADNTLVIFIEGDNGASAEAGPKGTLNELGHLRSAAGAGQLESPEWLVQNLDILGGPKTEEVYPVGWALALDTPFPWFKQIASHLGGVRNGLVISWPGRIKHLGELRSQYHHVIDILPTALDAAHVKAPVAVDGIAQQRIDGTSMTYTFDAPTAPSTRQTQYYEIMGNRGIYHDGWLANTTPRNMPWTVGGGMRPGSDITTYTWELYDLSKDFSQAHDLAAQEPQRLKELQALFDVEARRNNVYPIQDSSLGFRAVQLARATGTLRTRYVYWGKNIILPNFSAPPIFAFPFSVEADVEIPQGGATGVILAAGSQFGGWSLYLKDSRPIAYAAASQLPGQQFRIAADKALSPGPNKLLFSCEAAGAGGVVKISVNGVEVARADISARPRTLAGVTETFDIGRDSDAPVSDDYQNEGVFTGTIDRVEVDVKPPSGGPAESKRPPDPD